VKLAVKQTNEQREKRAQAIAAMNLVTREGDRFRVATPSLRGKQAAYEVWRDANGKVCCSCLEFEELSTGDPTFRCEHILAVKQSLLLKTSEAATRQPAPLAPVVPTTTNESETKAVEPETTVSEKQLNATEGAKTEENAVKFDAPEQQSDNVSAETSASEPAKVKTTKGTKEKSNVVQISEPRSLADTNTSKENEMKVVKKFEEMPFVTAEEAVEFERAEQTADVLEFTHTLRTLRQHVEPQHVKQREGWRDSKGNVHLVDYVEWHTVADILDETTPNWSHAIRDIKQIGEFIAITAAITINGVTREGVGTGVMDSEMGIKKAEHDALKRAAVKFGIARELYKRESDVIEREGSTIPPTPGGSFPANPVARSLADLVTPKQLGMIRAISREMNVDPDEECQAVMNCKTDELSKRAASALIQHLQTKQEEIFMLPSQTNNANLRRAM
jgi:hypothetical protein